MPGGNKDEGTRRVRGPRPRAAGSAQALKHQYYRPDVNVVYYYLSRDPIDEQRPEDVWCTELPFRLHDLGRFQERLIKAPSSGACCALELDHRPPSSLSHPSTHRTRPRISSIKHLVMGMLLYRAYLARRDAIRRVTRREDDREDSQRGLPTQAFNALQTLFLGQYAEHYDASTASFLQIFRSLDFRVIRPPGASIAMLIAPGRAHREAQCVNLPVSGIFSPIELERVAAQLRKRYDWYLDDFCDEEQIGGNGD
ncbi:hypothetical protein C8Q76DRAFT_804518 [Earliella scabrosa]|nr:hypothetical protein C8Q76DRAFT_804518 [Earliella scabrosa]